MSSPTRLRRGLVGVLAAALTLVLAPVAAQAAPVNLATVSPFVVLAGSTVTNEGPSVLNGDLGVSPGAALVGFGLPAVVNGATHANDAVAAQAQFDLGTAYDVAAGQPVAPADDLSGTDLGNRTLTPGAYRYNSDALLTGPLTLNAQGDPNAQFVFLVGSALTTESASSVNLINGASACNVHWKVGTSADLGTTTKFVGNLMALESISLKNAATVEGRMLARNGAVTLINNVLSAPFCPIVTDDTPSSGDTPPSGGPATGGPAAGTGTGAGSGQKKSGNKNRVPVLERRNGTAIVVRAPHNGCTAGFRATVRGRMIERVAFSLDGKAIGSRANSPFQISVRAAPGSHQVTARVTFKDATRAKTMRLPYRACAAALLAPQPGPSQFTG
jgi:hypothetical protein